MTVWSKFRAIALACVLLCTLAFTRPSLAYYTVTGTATNVVTSGSIKMKIHEQTKDGEPFPEQGIRVRPGDKVSKEVTVENTCTQPFYLRIRLTNGVEKLPLPVDDVFAFDLNTADWTLHEDGLYYYNSILQPREITSALFKEVELVREEVAGRFSGYTLTLTVTAEAVQSKNNPADHPWQAQGWPEAEGGQA